MVFKTCKISHKEFEKKTSTLSFHCYSKIILYKKYFEKKNMLATNKFPKDPIYQFWKKKISAQKKNHGIDDGKPI